jgi:TonB family protein
MFGVEEEVVEGPLAPSPANPDARIAPHFDEIVERLEHPQRKVPIERAILISLVIHILIVALWVLVPDPRIDPTTGRFAWQPPVEKSIPIKFFVESPGPSRTPPRNAPPSDASRRAGGGDRSKPQSDRPFIAPSSGIEGLPPGARGRPGAAAAPAPRGAAGPVSSSPPGPPSHGETPPSTATAPGALVAPRASGGSAGGPNGPPVDLRTAIREAVGVPGSGGLAGAPLSSAGGFVDSGPVSFDTQWYDWSSYAEEMVRRIKIHWIIPELAMVGTKGKLTIRFFIRADGSVEDAKIIRGSGIPPFDHAAFQAIVTSNPFRPLPTELHEAREGVNVTFFYNIKPGEEGKVP